MSQAELCLPIIPLLLFREEIMLGTYAHLWDPPSPAPQHGQAPGSVGTWQQGRKAPDLRGWGKVV